VLDVIDRDSGTDTHSIFVVTDHSLWSSDTEQRIQIARIRSHGGFHKLLAGTSLSPRPNRVRDQPLNPIPHVPGPVHLLIHPDRLLGFLPDPRRSIAARRSVEPTGGRIVPSGLVRSDETWLRVDWVLSREFGWWLFDGPRVVCEGNSGGVVHRLMVWLVRRLV
jgi:hypothetical protein